MSNFNRRTFLQVSTASLLRTVEFESAPATSARITDAGKWVRVKGSDYTWEWSPENDQLRLLDKWGLVIASGKLQPAVVVQPKEQKGARRCTAGKVAGREIRGNAVSIRYQGVNGSATLTVTWRFADEGFWLDPVIYETSAAEDVVSLNYFAEGTGERARPSLGSDYFVLPGISEASELSPIIPAGETALAVKQTAWLGHSMIWGDPEALRLQQWGLPAHYFCGFHLSPYDYQKTPHVDLKGAAPDELTAAFCCGLAEAPQGDLLAQTADDRCTLMVNYRGDLWGHLRGPGRLPLGAKLYWAVGPNYYEAIRRYYLGLLKAGVIRQKTNSPHKNEVALAPSFDTWGAQVARDQQGDMFDEPTLNSIYAGMKASGMKVKTFVIDGYWEGKYGNLRHSPGRFPHFEETLGRLRSEGYYVGLWAAFLRCADPSEFGLTMAHMLQRHDGQPFVITSTVSTTAPFYILDCSQPEVQEVLAKQVKAFMRRYKPDFVKFDFGYEIPALAIAAPKDMRWAGERLLLKGLEVIAGAMREENPDVVMMYYSLSPLLLEYIDLHSPDDMGMCVGDWDLEANRRFFFSSLLGEMGMPTWGSGGYEWLTSPEIWFDSAAMGTPGSLLSFSGPEAETLGKPARIAKFNGLAQVVRSSNTFSMIPIDAEYYGPVRGAHAWSWARIENGEVVLVALREQRLDGRKGAGKFRDLVSTNTSVVVASKTAEGLARAAKLAVVPYGQGEVTVKRETGASVDMTEHYFGGSSKTRSLSVEKGRLCVPLQERSEDGSVLEWIELDIA